MKILVNARLLNTSHIEGIGRYAYEIISRWVREQPNLELHLIYDRTVKHRPIEGPNVHYHRYGLPSRTPLLWRLWFDYSLRKAIDDIGPDVVFSPESYMCSRTDVPTVITTHDIAYVHYPEYNRSAHVKYFNRFFLGFHRRAAHVITVSNYSKRDICMTYGLELDKVSVVHNGVSDHFYPVDEISDFTDLDISRPYFLYLGAIHPRKNVSSLVAAFELLRSNGNYYQLVLAGRWAWDNDTLKGQISTSQYRNDIIILDYFDGDVNELLNGAVALCYLSLFEGFGLPIVEAMAAGCPVVCSDVTAMPEVAGDAALTVDPKDISAICAAMTDIATKPSLHQTLRDNGLERARRFSWDASAARILKILEEQSQKKKTS